MAKPAATNVPTTATAGRWMDASLGAEVGNGVADGISMEDDMEGIADDHEDHEDQEDAAVGSTRQNVELDMLQVFDTVQRHARKIIILTAGHHRVRRPGSGCSHGRVTHAHGSSIRATH